MGFLKYFSFITLFVAIIFYIHYERRLVENNFILLKVQQFFSPNLGLSFVESRYVNISGYFSVIHENGEILKKIYLDQKLSEIFVSSKEKKIAIYFSPAFTFLLFDVYQENYASDEITDFYEFHKKLKEFRDFLNDVGLLNKFREKELPSNSDINKQESYKHIQDHLHKDSFVFEAEFNSIYKTHPGKFIELTTDQFKNDQIVRAAVEYSTHLTFGSNYVPPIENIIRGVAYGVVEIIDPRGNFITHTFENALVYRGLAHFRNSSDPNSFYSVYIYYYSKCFNPFRSAYSTKNNVTFFPIDEEGIADHSRSNYINHDQGYEDLLTQSGKDMSQKYLKYMKNFQDEAINSHKQSINANDDSFKQQQKKIGREENLRFVTENIDHSNDSQVKSAISVASNRAFGLNFIEVLSTRKGMAYGKMNILQSDGTNKLFTFEGKNVYFELLDKDGVVISTYNYNDNPFIYEGLLRFKKDQNFEQNKETIDITVYYFSQCFNPLRVPHINFTSNVTFFPESGDPVEITHDPHYEVIYDKAANELYNNSHHSELLFETKPVIHKGKTLVIVDSSGSMTSILSRVEREAIEIVGKDYFKKFDGCYFKANLNDYTMTKFLINEISRDKEIDLVYFLADFQDFLESGVKNYLLKLFEERRIKFVLISYERDPHFELKSIVEATGGFIELRKYK